MVFPQIYKTFPYFHEEYIECFFIILYICKKHSREDIRNAFKEPTFNQIIKMKYIVSFVILLLSANLHAQEALWWKTPTTSPEINADKSVTFRIKAPKASRVQITGDFLPQTVTTQNGKVEKAPGTEELKEGENGIWEYTSDPLKPELYSYAFIVDGFRTLDPSNVHITRDVVTMSNVFIVGGGQADLYRERDVAHGTVSRIWYHSELNNADRRLTIYTPAGYEANRERYPVLYLLHGMGGDEEAWITLGRTVQIMDNLIAAGKAKPMIVVMTNGNVDQKAAPGYGPDGFSVPTIEFPHTTDGTFEQGFPEIVTFIDKTFRTIPQKKERAIAGLSMGGFHSMHISKENPDMFGYVGLFSASARMKGKGDSPIYKESEEKIIRQFSKGLYLYYIAIGKEDFLYEENIKLRKLLDDNNMKYKYRESDGGHSWRNWRLYLSEFAQMIF